VDAADVAESRAVLPTFVVIGAMKTGTSSLASYLREHPQVFMTTPKEPGFFSMRWDNGVDWYEALFDGAGDAVARGEASTNYTKAPTLPHVPERMAGVLPDVKLIYMVRNPITRIRSQYIHNAANKGERRPIDVAVRDNPDYIAFSRHAWQLELFLEHYPREAILVLSSERLRVEREATLKDVFQFIGVDADRRIPNLKTEFNRGADKRRIPAAIEYPRLWLNRVGIAQRFPESWREWSWQASKFGRIRASVGDDLAAWIWDQLADDLASLRGLVGPEFWLWDRA
jgi:hypothetical protein